MPLQPIPARFDSARRGAFLMSLWSVRPITAGLSLLLLAASASLAQTNLPTITSSTNTLGTVGQPFTYQITASGNPTSYGAFGLPSGLVAPTTNGMITGLPQRSGSYSSQIMAVNANGASLTNLAILINPPPAPVLASPVTVFGVQGQPLNYALLSTPNHSNVPTTFSVGGLPGGATLISNVTTNSAYTNVLVTNYFINSPSLLTNGSFVVPVVASNQGGVSSNSVTFIINGTNPPVFTISTNPVTATVGVPFSFDVTAINNPLRFRVTSIQIGTNPAVTGLNITNSPLANGLSFSNVTSGSTVIGRIYGTPGATNPIQLVIEAANNFGTATNNLLVNVVNPAPTVVMSQPLGEGNYVSGSSFYLNAQAFNTPEDILVPSSYQFQANAAPLTGTIGILGDFFGLEFYPASSPSTITASAQNALGQTSTSQTFNMSGAAAQAPLPSVEMLPLNFGQQLVAGGKVVLSARATIPSTTTSISRVEFYVNKVYVGSATAPQINTDGVYEYEWTTPATPGSFQVTARAVSINFTQAVSNIPFWASVIARKPTIVNTKQGAAPSVAITSPSNNGTLTIGVPNRIQATALLSGGSIDSVEFFANGKRITASSGTPNPDTSVPFEMDFTPNSFGAYEIYAIATGSNGLQTVSPVIVANVPTGFVPTVQITSPTSELTYPLGLPIVVEYTSNDTDGNVARVELLVNGAVAKSLPGATGAESGLIGNGNFPYTPPSQGVYEFAIRVTDNQGNIGVSQTVRLAVQSGAPNPLPGVILSQSPITEGLYTLGSKLFLNATVTPKGSNTISSVNFFANGNQIPAANSGIPPQPGVFAALYEPLNEGFVDLQATAKDSSFNIGISGVTTCRFYLPTRPFPTIEVLDLNPGTTPVQGGLVSLQARALFPTGLSTNSNGSQRVEFYVNGAFVGIGTNATATGTNAVSDPNVFRFDWRTPPATNALTNSYTVQARAVALDRGLALNPDNIVNIYSSIFSDNFITFSPGAAATPVVTILSPVAGTKVPVGTNITLLSTASVVGSTIKHVTYYANGQEIGSSSSAANSYSVDFAPTSKGNYTLIAVAESLEGFKKNSDPVVIEVPLVGDPSIEFLSPAAGIKFSPGTTFTSAAQVTINPTLKAPIRDVRFFVNEVQQGEPDTKAPYSQQITLPSVGNYFLKAIATDIYGNSAAVQRIVECADPPAGNPPLITMTHPTPGGGGDTQNDFSTSSDFFFNALVTLPSGVTVAPGGVKFFANGVPVTGTVNSIGNTYSIYWQPDQVADYSITAQVTDSRGITAVSSPLEFIIASQIRPLPTVNLLPFSSSIATIGSRVFIQVETNGGITPVSRIDFYANGILIGSRVPVDPANGTTTTTLFEWTPSQSGAFSITARAIQVLGEVGDNSLISNSRDLSVSPPAGTAPVVSLNTPPIAESFYVSGSQLFLNATVASSSPVATNGFTFYLGSSVYAGANSLQFFNGLPVYAAQVTVPEVSQGSSLDRSVFATAQDTSNNIGSSLATTLGFTRSLSILPTVQMLPVDTLQQLSAGSKVELKAAVIFPQAGEENRVEFYVNGALVGAGIADAASQNDGSRIYRYVYTVPDIRSSNGEVVEFRFQARAIALNFQTNTGNDNVRKYYSSIISAAEVSPVYFVPSSPTQGSNAQFVVDYFTKLFFRAPTYTEFEYYLGLLQTGSSQSQVIVAMAQSEAFNDVQGVLFGYYLRMGMRPASYSQVTGYVREMTNVLGIVPLSGDMSAGISNVPLPPSPYGATVGQANVAAALINANTNTWTNGLLPKFMDNTAYMLWMQRSFNSPYLTNTTTNTGSIGSPASITNTISSFPATNSPAVTRYGHTYAFMSALYAAMPFSRISSTSLVATLSNFPPYMQSVAVNYLLSPTNSTNSWNTNVGPISATNITPLLAPVISNAGTNVLPFGAAYALQITGQNFVSTTRFSASNLPAGLTINTNSGLISGAPTNSLVYTSSIVASNGPAAVGSNRIVFDVLPAAPLLSRQTLRVVVGESFTTTVNVLNTPTGFTISPAPSWLAVASNGVMTVQATNSSTNTFTVSAYNRGGTNTNSLVIEAESALASYARRFPSLGTSLSPSSDADGDGHTLAQEFAFGMNPTSRDAAPVSIAASNGEVHVSWIRRKTTDSVVRYVVKESPALAGLAAVWTNQSPALIPQVIQDIDPSYERVRVSVPISGVSRFFRVEADVQPGAL
jgi:hypothetical protein